MNGNGIPTATDVFAPYADPPGFEFLAAVVDAEVEDILLADLEVNEVEVTDEMERELREFIALELDAPLVEQLPPNPEFDAEMAEWGQEAFES